MIRPIQAFLFSIFRRDGIKTIFKLFRHALSRQSWQWLRDNVRKKRILKDSGLVDEVWYRREYPDVAKSGIDPVQDFMTPPHERRRLPNPDFVPDEYAAANFDVKASGLSSYLHYALHGKREKRPVSLLETAPAPFPDAAIDLRKVFSCRPPSFRRNAIFASFSGDGRIRETTLYYLRGLREVVDNVIFIANNPIFPEEAEKLKGLVRLAVFHPHGGYDFGSYKAGWTEAKSLGLLEKEVCDELVICNDSCYGPVFPFSEMFSEMEKRNAGSVPETWTDFWGTATMVLYGRKSIQSFFYVFRRRILDGKELDHWFHDLDPPHDRGLVIVRCESILTDFLVRAGYRADSFVPFSFFERVHITPTKRPLSLLKEFRMPLVKTKTLAGDSLESLDETRSFIHSVNPELFSLMPPPSGPKPAGIILARQRRLAHEAAMTDLAEEIRTRIRNGTPLRMLFLAVDEKAFSGEDLRLGPGGGCMFATSIVVVPDERLADNALRTAAMQNAEHRLRERFPDMSVGLAESDSYGNWEDFSERADVICFETAENASNFRYNPPFSIGRDFLPLLLFDHRSAGPYPLEKEFARQNYAYFWAIVFRDKREFETYCAHSIRKGGNAFFSASSESLPDRIAKILQSSFSGSSV